MVALETRLRVCSQCSIEFTYAVGRGTDRKHCSDDCRIAHAKAKKLARYTALPGCSVSGCSGKATRVRSGMCERHYCTLRRTGSLEPKLPRLRKLHGGYRRMSDPTHPLSEKTGVMYAHRYAAHQKHNGECPACFWCAAVLRWSTAVVDHLNEDKTDNHPDNLVVSCNGCNRARGAILPFIERMTDTAWLAFCVVGATHRARIKTATEDGGFGRRCAISQS